MHLNCHLTFTFLGWHAVIYVGFCSIWISTLLVTQHTPAVGTAGDIELLAPALAMAGDEGWGQRIRL